MFGLKRTAAEVTETARTAGTALSGLLMLSFMTLVISLVILARVSHAHS